jgi:hypothetical protein
VYEDRSYADEIIRWARGGRLGDVVVTSEADDLRQSGERAVEAHLKPKIRGAASVICLVGRDTHNHSWVRYELQVAASLNKHIVLVRIPGTTGPVPEGFRHLPMISYDVSSISSAIRA